jgi:NADH dehydrogenase FAD-containing subunit
MIPKMGKHLVFVGGGHAHLTALLHLADYTQRGHRVTVISSSPYHYYSGMGPGMLSGIYRPREVRFHIKKLTEDRGGVFMEDRVIRIDPQNRLLFLQSGEGIHYDLVSFNTGSEVPAGALISTPQENIFPVKPITHLLQARRFILKSIRNQSFNFIVAGGGPAGVEISANLWRVVGKNRGEARITLVAGTKLLGSFPDKVRNLALKSLLRKNIEVIEGNHIREIRRGAAVLGDGRTIAFDLAFLALGIKPSSLFRDSGLLIGEDGGLLVNTYLQSVVHPEIFGGGDCVSLAGRQLPKVGVYAVRQNPILFFNLLAALEGREMEIFRPQKDYMLILNMGDGRGILWKKNFVWEGRLSFLLKNMIDRRFMKKFQVSGELYENFDDQE